MSIDRVTILKAVTMPRPTADTHTHTHTHTDGPHRHIHTDRLETGLETFVINSAI